VKEALTRRAMLDTRQVSEPSSPKSPPATGLGEFARRTDPPTPIDIQFPREQSRREFARDVRYAIRPTSSAVNVGRRRTAVRSDAMGR
jgi:hypothetical protein